MGNTNGTNTVSLGLLDAIQATLATDPVIKLEETSVEFNRGVMQEATGQFDTVLRAALVQNRDYQPVLIPGMRDVFTGFRQDSTTYRASADKLTRSGITLSPGLEFNRLSDNSGQETINRAAVNFLIQVPLARGFGKEVVGAAEKAAQLGWEAGKYNLRHLLSLRVLNTTAAYWHYAAAAQRLSIVQQAERRAQLLVVQIESLVKADEQPRSELDKLTANLANNTALRISTEQALLEARKNLGISIGTPFEQIHALGNPSDLLLESAADVELSSLPLNKLSMVALMNRQDITAATKNRESAEALLSAARNNLKPKVDLVLKAGYAGAEGGAGGGRFFTPFGQNLEGPNGYAALSFELPPANNSARGILVQRQATLDSSVIRTDELIRNVQADVYVGLERLRSTAQQLAKSKEATELYAKAVINEKTKLNLSTATILDVLTLEDRLTSASLTYVSAQQDYATAVVTLRYLTGTLLQNKEDMQTVTLDTLTTLPPVKDLLPAQQSNK